MAMGFWIEVGMAFFYVKNGDCKIREERSTIEDDR